MAMAVRSYYRSVMSGASVPFGAFGGTGPYVWTIGTGGVGGSITSAGLYTAPQNKTGMDTVIATDSLGETAQLKIGVGTVLHVLADIIRKELNLAPDQVLIQNQKFNIENDSKMYCSVKILTSRAIANRSSFEQDGTEFQSVNMFASIDLAVYSVSTEALVRKEQVVMALNSNYAKQQQQLNGFLIGSLGNIVPLNNIEGAAIPYFYNVNFNIQYAVSSQKAVDYFDQFEGPELITNP